jgi:predicted metal-dependent peptidase
LKGKIHPKLQQSVEEFLCTGYMYYAEFSLFINFYERLTKHFTCGVNVTTSMNFYWNKEYINTLNQKEVNFVFIHELFHLLFDHQSRTTIEHHERLANIAQDMIINEIIVSDISDSLVELPKLYDKNGKLVLDVDNQPIDNVLRKPDEYNEEMVFEILYVWLRDKKDEYERWLKRNGENGQDNSNGENGQDNLNGENGQDPCPVSNDLRRIFNNIINEDNPMDIGQFDEHLENEGVPKEIREQIIKDVMNNLKNRGLETGNVISTLNKLRKSKKNYLKELKSSISMMKGFRKERSFARPNRRNIPNIKGNIKKGKEINCILDTSGSMYGYLEKVISYLLHGEQLVNFIQIDTEVKSHLRISSKHEYQRVNINGGGGTELQPAIEYIRNKKILRKNNLVILTDGYTDNLNLTGINKTLIISCGDKVPIDNGNNIKQIIIEE